MGAGDHEQAREPIERSQAPDPAVELQAREHVGPLLLTRWRKRDGRALLLYARTEGEADDGAAGERLQ